MPEPFSIDKLVPQISDRLRKINPFGKKPPPPTPPPKPQVSDNIPEKLKDVRTALATEPLVDILTTEKPASAYETNYTRENEIKEVAEILNHNPMVMVTGEEGCGKTGFINEIQDFIQKQGIQTYLYDCHIPDRALSNSFRPEVVRASTSGIKKWIETQNAHMPHSQRPVLFLDAGDFLFLQSDDIYYVRGMPYYGSEKWQEWLKIKEDPDKWKEFIKEREWKNIQEFREKYPNITDSPEEELNSRIETYDAKLAVAFVKRDLMQTLRQAIADERIRIISTDHAYPKEKLAENPYLAPPVLVTEYDSVFQQATRYDLPRAYEVNRVRMVIANMHGITDPSLQDEIIRETGAMHQKIKYPLTKEVMKQFQEEPSKEKRAEILQNAIQASQPPTLVA